MNTAVFHIHLYDLLLTGSAFCAMTFSLLLAFAPNQRRAANRFISLALLVAIFGLVQRVGSDMQLPGWDHLPWQWTLAIGPLLYFYVRKITCAGRRFAWSDLLHLLPALVQQFLPGLSWLAFVSVWIYLYGSHRLILKYYQRLEFSAGDRYRVQLRWLQRLLLLLAMVWLLWLPFQFFAAEVWMILFSAAMIAMGIAAHLWVVKPMPAAKPMIAGDTRRKAGWLKQAMKRERYYLDPELSLSALAERLGLHTHELSRVMNTVLKKSFNDFVNEYRVNEVIRKMADPGFNYMNLLGIALASGFNSKATFNRAFKQFTGHNPAEYQKMHQKDVSTYNLQRQADFADRTSAKLNLKFMFKNYLKIAWRNLWRHKRLTLINVAGLSIGIAATVMIVLWVQNEMSFDRFEPDAANTYLIKASLSITKTETWQWENSQYILGEHVKAELPEVTNLARLQAHYGNLTMHLGDRIITEKQSAYVDVHWFDLFRYDLINGSFTDFNNNPFSLVLTQSAARRYFGEGDAIGKVLRIDTNNYQVRAVVKDYPANSSFRFNVLLPIAAKMAEPNEKKNALQWGNYNYLTFLKLRPGTNTQTLASKLLSILRTNRKDDKGNTRFSLLPLSAIHFETDLMNSILIHGNRTIVNVFLVMAALLLVTACINYVNLTTARSSLRSKEVSVRKIVGAGKAQLFGQFMAESFLVSLLAVVVALLLVLAATPWFRTFTDRSFGDPLTSGVVWLIVGGTLLVSFLLNGLYPAFLLASFQPLSVFRGRSLLAIKDVSLRRILVVTQFTISVILIAGTLVIYRQMNYIQSMDPGYNRSEVFSFSFPWWSIPHVDFNKSDQLMATVKTQLQAESATSNVATGGDNLVNFDSSSSGSFDWPGRDKDFKPAFAPLSVDPDLARLLELKIKQGRWFNNSPADRHNVLLNETALNMIALRGNPIGQRFIHQGDTGVIIGVVKDFHFRSLHDKIGPMILTENNPSGFYIKAAKGNAAAAIAAATKVWKQYFPDTPFDYTFLDDAYHNLYQAEQQQSLLITVFALIAVFISALGLLGLAAFAAEQKVKEIGIRKVLGASVADIMTLLSTDFIKMVLIATLIGCPVAWWAMNKWLQGFAYREGLSWWLFALSGGIALLIALVTVSFQSVKAALSNPVNSLRNE